VLRSMVGVVIAVRSGKHDDAEFHGALPVPSSLATVLITPR
jgi:hypothetical protein